MRRASPTSAAAAWPCGAATTRRTAASSASPRLGCRCARSAPSPAPCGWLPTGSSPCGSMILSAAIFINIVGLLGYLHFVKVDQETLLIIDSLGIQMTSSYASGKENTTFIEMDKVKDVIINEAIYMQKVIYYLCILLKDPGKPQEASQVVPVFQSAKPRLDCLIEIYRSCQEILAHQKATSTRP
ncbi:phosphatidylinositol N-acetylglucosaminyltransferase subunit H isoform X3 [Meriones unguiculatus]|uniref:phosphatidylinositol N-acetylglucosaminyltransferase subunit H isoform X3 n=1 Tax=Meriones unguiculatus TaxID=10047 RepID=UPI00293EA27F|nr:phosphatidylinositol N-acetylglucosaminyltransferase subunit H isoform X3 [Meriones unguiculatus]